MDQICYGCFAETKHEHGICTKCGYDGRKNREEYPLALPGGSILCGRYIVGKVLGQGGFGITYLAQDYQTKEFVAIKEFFPDTMATRTNTVTVTPFSGDRGENFSYGRTSFLDEAKTMAEFNDNPNVAGVRMYFEENGTAYFVMEYIDGCSLQTYIKNQGGRISWDETMEIICPVLDALSAIHDKGIIHRDVTPDNIYITRDGKVKLLDFGAARHSLGNVSRSLDVILKHGFAPKEQYSRRGRQGPYTDVYSVSATIYYALTGVKPDDAIERTDEDNMPPPSNLGARITQKQEDVLLKGLSVNASDRYQSARELWKALVGDQDVPVPPVIIPASDVDTVASPGKEEKATKVCDGDVSGAADNMESEEIVPAVPADPVEDIPRSQNKQPAREPQAADIPQSQGAQTLVAEKEETTDGGAIPVTVHVPADEPIKPVVKVRKKPAKLIAAIACGAALAAAGVLFWFLHPHMYGDWVVTKEATCLEAGSRYRKCFCGEIQQETTAHADHQAVTDSAVPATCIKTGLTEGSHCSVCDIILEKQNVVPATGHTIEVLEAIAPTCTEAGRTEGVGCIKCDYTRSEPTVIPALGHTVVTDAGIAPTCQAEGKSEGSHCSVCNEVLVAQEVLEKTGHTVITIPAVAATCTEDGLSEGSRCSVCNEVLVAQQVTEKAKGHSFSNNSCTYCSIPNWTAQIVLSDNGAYVTAQITLYCHQDDMDQATFYYSFSGIDAGDTLSFYAQGSYSLSGAANGATYSFQVGSSGYASSLRSNASSLYTAVWASHNSGLVMGTQSIGFG